MFGHDHESERIAEHIDHLMAAVFVADEDKRMEARPDTSHPARPAWS